MKKFFLLGFKKEQINLISNKFKKHQFFFEENNFNNEVSGYDAIIAIIGEKIDTCVSKFEIKDVGEIYYKYLHICDHEFLAI